MKFNKKMLFGLIAQLLFAIFVIIALYATGFDHMSIDGFTQKFTFKELADNSSDLTGDLESIYGLGLASIVIVFVTIVLPLVSMLVENENMNKAFGWATLVLDVTVLALLLGAFGLYTSDATKDGGKLSNAGYIAGSFIFTIVGAGVALAGNSISYKDALAK